MSELDRLYIAILYHGLISIRNASINGDLDFCRAESEYLHEIPSLIGETNMRRHIYQATKVRPTFLKWANDNRREDVLEFVKTWFAAEWKRIDAILGVDPPIDHL
jgi:hypothetical protein